MSTEQPPFEKLERDGDVAVLISPGFGADWSTWNRDYPGILFDKEIVEAVLTDDKELAESITKKKYPDAFLGGLGDVEVQWVPKGSRLEVDEYDGSESLRILSPDDGIIA